MKSWTLLREQTDVPELSVDPREEELLKWFRWASEKDKKQIISDTVTAGFSAMISEKNDAERKTK